MCGLAGVFNISGEPADERKLRRMASLLAHRGPDGEGFFTEGAAGLGHRRLSIIDIAGGHQPMMDDTGRYVIALNGEIYNYIELRRSLSSRNVPWKTKSDTEVALYSFIHHGPGCVKMFDGIFAFAVYDRLEKRMFIARDHLGVKPLYYAFDGRSFVFASEIKAILAYGATEFTADFTAIADYMTFGYTLGSKTFFRDVSKLPAGHHITVSASGASPPVEYWRPSQAAEPFTSDEEAAEAVKEALTSSVKLQLRADVEVGLHLSGGLDSSAIASLAAPMYPGRMKSFTGAFLTGPYYDESDYARIVSAASGTDHFEIYPDGSDFLNAMERLMWLMDEPAAGYGVYPQSHVSALAASNVKCVLGGQGGDELFLGYPRYFQAMDAAIKSGAAVDGFAMRDFLRTLAGIYLRLIRLMDDQALLGGIISKDVAAAIGDYTPGEASMDDFTNSSARDYPGMMTIYDIRHYLSALLHVEDRVSMGVSLESRVPILGVNVVETALRVPATIKCAGGQPKSIMKKALEGVLPQAILARKDKKGFPTPLHIWFRRSQRQPLRELLLSGDSRIAEVLDKSAVKTAYDAHMAGNADNTEILWRMSCVEIWMRIFRNVETVESHSRHAQPASSFANAEHYSLEIGNFIGGSIAYYPRAVFLPIGGASPYPCGANFPASHFPVGATTAVYENLAEIINTANFAPVFILLPSRHSDHDLTTAVARVLNEHGFKVSLVAPEGFGQIADSSLFDKVWKQPPGQQVDLSLLQCQSPWNIVYMTPDGSLWLTAHKNAPAEPIGNVSGASFNDIWNGAKAREFRRNVMAEGASSNCGVCFNALFGIPVVDSYKQS